MARSSKRKRKAAGETPVAAAAPMRGWVPYLQAALIVVAGFWIYSPALHGGWVMDDLNYIPQNGLLRDAAGLWKIWFSPGSFIEYYPILASVEWVEWNLFGNDTLDYHLLNVFLHVANALLVWRLLARFGLRLAWLGGLIFVVHPAMVESVAWISELKNTLSLLPFLLAMTSWIDYEERGATRDYWLALGLFLVAMLCKVSMVPFPLAILLYAWWKRGRVGWRDLRASAPFFAISLALGLLSLSVGSSFQEHYMPVLDPVPMGGFLSRLACAGLALSQYFWNCLCPVNLMPVYPRWKVDPPSVAQFLPWPIFAGLFYWLWRERRGWGRHVLLGTGFFVLNLLPFLEFKTISYMSYTWVMDHFLYLPILGLIGLAVAGMEWIRGRLTPIPRLAWMAGVGMIVLLLAWSSRGYARAFINGGALASYTIARNPGAWTAHNELGIAEEDAGRWDEAIAQFSETLRIKPDYVEARYNLGNTLLRSGRYAEALAQYREVLRDHPNYPKAHNNIAVTLLRMGRMPEAIGEFEAELRLYPGDADARNNLRIVESLQVTAPAKHN